ncbi:MAG TPA: nuclear transport factor 2 family protein [Candidatus Methylacidiphilales bacterium]|nr:nuclear transport factor 2 family protein [Candidatus Methylacidiphilales bacterium]
MRLARAIFRPFSIFLPRTLRIQQSPELPWGGVYRGHDEARQFFAKLVLRINSTLELKRFIIADERAVAVGWTQGSVIATGVKYRVAIVHIWTIAEEKVARVEFIIDNLSMLEALAKEQHA